MSISLEFDENKFEKLLLHVIAKSLNRVLGKVAKIVLDESRLIVRQAITDSPEYSSILGRDATDLQAHFGLISPSSIINDIIYQIQDSMTSEIVPVKLNSGNLGGGFSIKILRSGYQDLLSIRNTSYISRGYSIDWLRWLLLEGSRDITTGFDIIFGNYPQARSKRAVMIESISTWHVPNEYAGVNSNNWLTRALTNINKKVAGIIKVELSKLA